VRDDAGGVVEETDQLGLNRGGAVVDVGAEHGVGLPHLVGVLLGKGKPAFVLDVGVGFEQFEFSDHSGEGVRRDLLAAKQPPFDADLVDVRFLWVFVMESRKDLLNGLQEFLGRDFSEFTLVGTLLVMQGHEPEFLVTPEPCLNASPGKLPWDAILVGEDHRADVLQSFVLSLPWRGIDGAQNSHLKIGTWPFHTRTPS